MPFSASDFAYGPVVVLRGRNKGRIGFLDNDTHLHRRLCGIVKFADPMLSDEYVVIRMDYLDIPNTQQILSRYQQLRTVLSPYKQFKLVSETRLAALEEFSFVSNLLNERMFEAQFERSPRGAKLFVSHSSLDKGFVRGLCVDLAARGHQPWLDEWEILAGDSITERIGTGIDDSDFVIVVLSEASVKSKWVEQEWQAKHWVEVTNRQVQVIPVLKDSCDIPVLLRTKKYVDLRDQNYSQGLDILVKSIGAHLERRAGA